MTCSTWSELADIFALSLEPDSLPFKTAFSESSFFFFLFLKPKIRDKKDLLAGGLLTAATPSVSLGSEFGKFSLLSWATSVDFSATCLPLSRKPRDSSSSKSKPNSVSLSAKES